MQAVHFLDSTKDVLCSEKILKIRALFEKVSPLIHPSSYPKATVMQLKRFFLIDSVTLSDDSRQILTITMATLL